MGTTSFKLISNNICYGPMPDKSDEVEQHLTVSSSGRVWFSARNYEQYVAEKGFCRKKQMNIGKWKAQFLINIMRNVYPDYDVTDCGFWDLIIREGDKRSNFSGPLIGNEIGTIYDNTPVPVTKLLRRYIPVYSLWGFDSKMAPDYEGKKAIFLFTEKWIHFFSTGNDKDFDFYFGEDCNELGFQMDGGAEFERQYPGCFDVHNTKLQSVINEIDDVDLLGSAVFSYWRYLTHWAGPYELNEEICTWFLLILSRMRGVTKKN